MAKHKLRKGEKALRPLHPNVGTEMQYRKRLYDLIDDMTASVRRWITAAYRKAEPKMAQDDALNLPRVEAVNVGGKRPWIVVVDGQQLQTSKGVPIRFSTEAAAITAGRVALGELLPADLLQAAMSELGDYWLERFDIAAPKMARWFARSTSRRTDDQMRSILRDGGISVRFQPTPEHLDVLRASVHENVALIRSIPQQYLKNVEGMVMRSVQRGRDIGSLTKQLQTQYGVTKRRAAIIARDQNAKATSAYQEARRTTLGIMEAIWHHSHAGKTPRPKHLAADGKRYKVGVGLPVGDKGQYVLPGEEINCRCTSSSIIPGLNSI